MSDINEEGGKSNSPVRATSSNQSKLQDLPSVIKEAPLTAASETTTTEPSARDGEGDHSPLVKSDVTSTEGDGVAPSCGDASAPPVDDGDGNEAVNGNDGSSNFMARRHVSMIVEGDDEEDDSNDNGDATDDDGGLEPTFSA